MRLITQAQAYATKWGRGTISNLNCYSNVEGQMKLANKLDFDLNEFQMIAISKYQLKGSYVFERIL